MQNVLEALKFAPALKVDAAQSIHAQRNAYLRIRHSLPPTPHLIRSGQPLKALRIAQVCCHALCSGFDGHHTQPQLTVH
jgi:hypothetical protein